MLEREEILDELNHRELPDYMQFHGKRIDTPAQWAEKREEIKKLVCQELYGYMPFRKWEVHGRVLRSEADGYGGKVQIDTVEVQVSTVRGVCSFPFQLAIPKQVQDPPVFLHITGFPADYMVEELTDCGYAVASVFYQDIMPDRPEAVLEGVGRIIEVLPEIGWGKIAMWAFGISRITDYLMTRADIDRGKIAIVGHSRLGKATLLCGALDERFSLVISAGSGAGGAALFRGKVGEQIENLSRHWFCGNMKKYAGHPEQLPFDQHFLIALAAPGRVYISSADVDQWADPESEFLSCVAASSAYDFLGRKGLVYERYPATGEALQDGCIAYHRRQGTHALTRQDWHLYMQYRERWQV